MGRAPNQLDVPVAEPQWDTPISIKDGLQTVQCGQCDARIVRVVPRLTLREEVIELSQDPCSSAVNPERFTDRLGPDGNRERTIHRDRQ
jgi:hypothetical protein